MSSVPTDPRVAAALISLSLLGLFLLARPGFGGATVVATETTKSSSSVDALRSICTQKLDALTKANGALTLRVEELLRMTKAQVTASSEEVSKLQAEVAHLKTQLAAAAAAAGQQAPAPPAVPVSPPAFQRSWGFWRNDPIAAIVGKAVDPPELIGGWPNIPLYAEPSREWPLLLPRCRHHIFAQGMQDGLLLCIFAAIGPTNRYFVEFGHTSFYESNAGALYLLGWRGLFLDGRSKDERYNSHAAFIAAPTICEVFRNHSVPTSFDYLSADIDSLELYVVHELFKCGYKPRVFSIEYNCHVPLDKNWTVNEVNGKSWGGGCYYGLSLGAAAALGERWGYALVAVDVLLDAFFVHKSLLPSGVVFHPLDQLSSMLCRDRPLHPCANGGVTLDQGWVDVSTILSNGDATTNNKT